MVTGCFWPNAPKTATPLPDNNCASGPAISNVSNISQTALTVSFTGSGVTSLKWRIKSGGTEVRSGTTNDFGSATSTTYRTLRWLRAITHWRSKVTTVLRSKQPRIYDQRTCGNDSRLSERTFGEQRHLYYFTQRDNQLCRHQPARVLMENPDGSNFAVGSGKTGTLTSNSANLTFSYLQNGTYTFELKAEDCKSDIGGYKKFQHLCNRHTYGHVHSGPNLQSIVSSGETGLQFLFDGDNVFAIDWKVKKDGVLMRPEQRCTNEQ